jgi:hypothetical protein
MKTLLVCSLALALVVQGPKAKAQSLYHQGEVTIDTFATHSYAMKSPGSDLHTHDGVWGYGVGGSYFFHRNFGLGVDAVVKEASDRSGTLFDEISLSLTARLPLGESGLAPYVTLGGGRKDGAQLGHAAAGLEYRFLSHAGVFAEGRYQWVNDAGDAAQLRAGLRFAF